MICPSCQSHNQAEFTAEMIVHLPGSEISTSPAYGYSRSCRSASTVAFLGSLSHRRVSFCCSHLMSRRLNRQHRGKVFRTSHALAGSLLNRDNKSATRLDATEERHSQEGSFHGG